MSVLLPFPIDTVEKEKELPSLTYGLDIDRNRIVGKIDGIEAVNQFIRKALATPRFKCLIYDNQWGSEIKEIIIAGDATPKYIESDLPRLITDTLSVDSRILNIYNIEVSLKNEKAYVKFTVDTVFGQTTIEEVI